MTKAFASLRDSGLPSLISLAGISLLIVDSFVSTKEARCDAERSNKPSAGFFKLSWDLSVSDKIPSLGTADWLTPSLSFIAESVCETASPFVVMRSFERVSICLFPSPNEKSASFSDTKTFSVDSKDAVASGNA